MADKSDGWIHATYWKYLSIGSEATPSNSEYRPSQLAFESLNPDTKARAALRSDWQVAAPSSMSRGLRLDADCVDHLLESSELFDEIEFFRHRSLDEIRDRQGELGIELESTILAELEATMMTEIESTMLTEIESMDAMIIESNLMLPPIHVTNTVTSLADVR